MIKKHFKNFSICWIISLINCLKNLTSLTNSYSTLLPGSQAPIFVPGHNVWFGQALNNKPLGLYAMLFAVYKLIQG